MMLKDRKLKKRNSKESIDQNKIKRLNCQEGNSKVKVNYLPIVCAKASKSASLYLAT